MMRLPTLALGFSLALAPMAGAQDEAPLILIPSFTAPATAPGAGPDAGAIAPEGEAVTPLSPAEIGQMRTRIEPAVPDAGAAPEPAPALAPLLSHVAGAVPGQSVRMQGENPVAGFSIFLPVEAVPGALRIAHMSGVDVLPDRSIMVVSLNGEEIGRDALGNFDPAVASLFDVPAGLWRDGRNEVTIRLEQAHRLFCGPEAAFDLWSDIDLTSSGAVLDQRALSPGAIDFLAGIARDAGIGLPIAIKDPGDLALAGQPVLDALARRLAEVLRGRVLSYEEAGLYDAAGVDEAAPQRMARIVLVPTYGPPSAAFRQAGDGALVLALGIPPEGVPAADAEAFLDTVLRDIMTERFALDAEAVSTGIDPHTQMQTGVPVTLAELGMETTRTSSHYFRRDQVFTLPRDWLVLTAQKATLHLDYIYARNLPEKSELLIRINGETVRLLPLRGEGGELIEQFPVKFYANLLREGPNLIQFEALIPGTPEDQACPPGQFPKLEIRGSSTLTVPPSPRLRLNGLRLPVYALRSGGLTLNGAPLDELPLDDRLTLVATLGEPNQNASHLTAFTFDNLNALPLGTYDIAREVLAGALSRPAETPAADPDRGPAPQDRIGELPEDLFGPVIREPRDQGQGGLLNLADSFLGSLFGTSAGEVNARIGEVGRKLMPDVNADAEGWLADKRAKAILAQLDPRDPRQVHLVLGPGTTLTEVAAAISGARRTIGGPSGQLSVLGHDGVWRSWADGNRFPMLMEPLTVGNYRQVLGNYASWSPVSFTAILFAFAFVAAMIALRLVVITRGKP